MISYSLSVTMLGILKNPKLLLHLSVCFLLPMVKVKAITRTTHMTKLERTTALDDYTCFTKDLLISTKVLDVSMCAFLCMENDTCQTMFYNQQERICNGCAARYTVASLLSPSSGFIHFQKAQTTCDADWAYFQGSCYILSPNGNFEYGNNYCENNNAHPVYVETSEENEFLKSFLTSDTFNIYWFIGMTDSVESGVWRYYNTNELVIFFDFLHSEPNDFGGNSQQCAIFYKHGLGSNYQWADHFCSDDIPTICEKTL